MELLAKQLRQIGGHLAGLTTSQRLALLASIVVVVLGMALLLQWSGQAEMTPLIDQPLKAEELTTITNELTARGAKFRVAGSTILVPTDERSRWQGVVAQSGAMPADTTIGFARLIEQSNMWLPRDESRWQRKIALGNELAKVLSNFDGIAEAKVFVDQPERRGFGESVSAPTASVFLKTRPGVSLDKSRVSAIASLVSGAIQGMRPEAVKIVDATSGRPYRVPAEEESLPFDLHDLRRQKEDYFGRKILTQLGYIGGVLVGVNVELDMDRRREHQEKFGPPQPSEEETSSSESVGQTAAASPGVRPNTAAALPGAGSNESSNMEQSRTSLLGERDKMITDTTNTPGVVRKVTASVNVPRSYFVAIYKALNAGKEPTSKDLDPIISDEEKKIRGQVRSLISASADDQVAISWFYDAPSVGGPTTGGVGGASEAASQPLSATALFRDHGRTVGLGVVVLISLLMVMQMGRKAIPKPPPPPVPVAAAAVPAGESGAIIHPAAAKLVEIDEPEPDERTVRTKAMVAEIRKSIGEDPEAAAAIVERWVMQPR